jgi:hypothetical protein
MTDSVTPGASTAPSGEYDDDDYLNAERLEGVEDDEDTADEDPDEVLSDVEEDDVRPLMTSSAVSSSPVSCVHTNQLLSEYLYAALVSIMTSEYYRITRKQRDERLRERSASVFESKISSSGSVLTKYVKNRMLMLLVQRYVFSWLRKLMILSEPIDRARIVLPRS